MSSRAGMARIPKQILVRIRAYDYAVKARISDISKAEGARVRENRMQQPVNIKLLDIDIERGFEIGECVCQCCIEALRDQTQKRRVNCLAKRGRAEVRQIRDEEMLRAETRKQTDVSRKITDSLLSGHKRVLKIVERDQKIIRTTPDKKQRALRIDDRRRGSERCYL